MPSPFRQPRSTFLVAALSLLPFGGALAEPPPAVSLVTLTGAGMEPLPPERAIDPLLPSAYALRMDNYVDVVDSILNARTGSDDASTATTAPAATAREDSLYVRRFPRPPHLPEEPLLVRTTAAFADVDTSRNAASWPPTSGRLLIDAADGSHIELDAGDADAAAVKVTVVSGTRVFVFREPWATWAPPSPEPDDL